MKLLIAALSLLTAQVALGQNETSANQAANATQPAERAATRHFEVGINGGYFFNTLPDAGRSAFETNEVTDGSPKSNRFTGSISVAYRIKKYSIGVSASTINMSYWINYKDMAWDGIATSLQSQLIPIKLFLNRTVIIHRNECYFGVSGGYVNKFSVKNSGGFRVDPGDKYSKGDGTTMGLQTGITHYFNKHIGVNAEVRVDYLQLNVAEYKVTTLAVPVTAGILYRL